MKKLITLLAFITSIHLSEANAQTEKGTYLLGGNASFQTTNGFTTLVINPGVGYFFKDNLAGGVGATLFIAEGYNSYNVGPYARYYFGPKTNGKFFGSATVTVGGGKYADVSVGAGVGAGYAFFLNKSIALETGAYYNRIFNGVGLFGLNVGFQIHLKK